MHFFCTCRPAFIDTRESNPPLILTINRLLILLLFFFLVAPCDVYAVGDINVPFTGLDRLHIAYNAQPTDWDTLYPELERETTDIVLLQYRTGSGDPVETTVASGSGGIQGSYHLTGMGTDRFRYTVIEYYRTYNEGTAEWNEGSGVRDTIDDLVATREISGTLLFNEAFNGEDATDITLGQISVPYGKSLILQNMNPASGQSSMGIGGAVTIEGCTELELMISGDENSQLTVRLDCSFSSLRIDSMGQISIGSTKFLKGCTPVIGGLFQVGSLSLTDCTFLDGGSISAETLCRINGCDFLRGTVKVDTNTDSLSILDNVFAKTLVLKVNAPDTDVPTISGNSFVGPGTQYSSSIQVLTIEYALGLDGTPLPLNLAGNYWGGKNGPRPKHDWSWLGQWGAYNLLYNGSDAVLGTGIFHAQAAPAVDPLPPPMVWVENYRYGQNTLMGKGRKGRDTLLCYDLRANVEELSGAEFWLTVDGQRVDPLNPMFVVKRDYGLVPAFNNMDRTLNFLLPADMTTNDGIDIELNMDLTDAGPFDTDVGPAYVSGFSLTLDPPPARPLRLGLVRVDVRLSGFNTAPSPAALNKMKNLLEIELPAMFPITSQELEVVDMGTYQYDGGLYGNWVLNAWRSLFAHRLSWTLNEFMETYNASVPVDQKIDYLIASVPKDAFGTGNTGTNFERMPRICLVDSSDAGAVMHELGHAIGGLYRSTEQYDLSGVADAYSITIDEGVGAVLQGVTAFNPEAQKVSVVSSSGQQHFPTVPETRAWDIMSNNSTIHWIIPTTLESISQSLESLLGLEGAEPEADGSSPAEESSFRETAGSGRRVIARGLMNLTMYGYFMVPGSISCTLAETSMAAIPGETPLILEDYQPYYGNPTFVAFDAYGNQVYSDICRRTDGWLPNYSAWVQTFDVPESAVKYEIQEHTDGQWDGVALRQMIGPEFITEFSGPTEGSQLGDSITLSWGASFSETTPAGARISMEDDGEPITAPQGLSYQLYYSTDGGIHWIPISTPAYSTTIEIPTDFLPESIDITFKLVTSDGFQAVEKVLENFSLANRPPTVTIVAPAEAIQAEPGTGWTLSATALDPEDGSFSQGLWESNLDGELGINCTISGVELSEGEHTLTFTAHDSQGLEASASIGVTVGEMETVDLRVNSQALNITGYATDPILGVSGRIQVGELNTITVTVQNQGIDNRAKLEVFLTEPEASEVSVSNETFDWTPFAQHGVIFQHLANQVGTYTIRALITCESMTDPVPENDEYTWTFANEASVAFGDVLTVEEDETTSFDLTGRDPDGDEIDFAIVNAPVFGNVVFVEYNAETLETAHYEYTSTSYGGTDSFTFTASDGSLVSEPATIYVLVTPLPTVPDAPYSITAGDGTLPDGIPVNWSAVPDAGGYELYRSTEMVSAGAVKIGTTLTATAYTDMDEDISPGKYYFYWVKAVNDAGSSGFSPLDWGFVGEEEPRRFWSFEAGGPVAGSPTVPDIGDVHN